ncbi:MAG: ASCH domain-containing protein [Anaerolineales bacterium]|jgi:uncharacterized protein YhfF
MTNENDELSIRRYWQAFLDSLPPGGLHPPDDYQAWSFGNSPEMADELGELVRQGKKTATASLVWMFEAGIDPYPQVGEYHVILNGLGKPICIIQTTELEVKAFDEVGEEQAYLEGEGDRSLHYWREAHWAFFTEECKKLDRVPNMQMPVLCEKFALIYTQDH